MPFHRASRATAHDAIAYLASACDGARRRDHHGFNADHVADGRRLAKASRWSHRDHGVAKKLIRHYRRQLEVAGYNVNALLGRRGRERKVSRRRATPAGWAVDPTGVHALRYWDGHRWTGSVVNR